MDRLEANRLIDLAEAGDREQYRAELMRIQDDHGRARRKRIARVADFQINLYENYTRLQAWRADWINGGRDRDSQ